MNEEWNRFIAGKWQKEMPQKSGKYPVKSFRKENETMAGYSFEVVFEDRVTHECRSVHSWGGLWWSEPLPDEMPVMP